MEDKGDVREGLMGTLRGDLWTMAADPLPRMNGPRWLARLPHVLVVVCAIFMVQSSSYGSGQDPTIPVLAMLQATALVVAMFLPIPAWWASTVIMVIGALIVEHSSATWDIPRGGMSFPWSIHLMALQAGVLFLLALRVRPRVVAETLGITVLTGLACVYFVNPSIGPGEIVLAIPVLVTVLAVGVLMGIGAVLRGERVARTRLFRQQQLTAAERARRTVLEERNRIARELHDVVAHHMSMISIQAQVAPHLVKDPPVELTENLAGIRQNAVEALTELRRVLGVLRSQDALAHAPQPTLDRLAELAGSVRAAGLTLAIETTGEPRPLSPGVELSAFRIIQEALSNAMRHAPGAAVHVKIGYRTDALAIQITNTAPDRPPPPAGPGHGLLGMRERTAMLGGELAAGPTRDGGYEVTATLPAMKPPAEDPP
ncbi:sensor histidine kinase [Acrocarpospora macrocephala]|uniref:histidine kinase n=1 Tax=Acrocarpospora macrocephala TaxID=150177 RepID=A0A5M3WXD4_9ACTN|nr:histidine kinase [Acrocarpospora macrocephala]GES11193.1 two-component sensor histidine kinase [Acrocarpospora macrocephala]